jgi:hypothetical protein
MTGTHVFAGTFSGPCSLMVANGFATWPCISRNATSPKQVTHSSRPSHSCHKKR